MYTTNDSGERVDFSTGSKRDTNEGKSRVDLIWIGFLFRLGDLLARGAKKYGENNWMLGQPISRSYESALRHLLSWREGETTEDHLAAVCFNVMSIMYVVAMVKLGKLPMTLMQDTTGYFNCADMPTPELQKAVIDHASVIDIIRRLIKQPSTLYDIWNSYGNNYSSLNETAEYLAKHDVIAMYNGDKYEFSGFLTKMILKTLFYTADKGCTYKYLRDRVEVEYVLFGKPTEFNGGLFLEKLGQLEKLGIIGNRDGRDGNYTL